MVRLARMRARLLRAWDNLRPTIRRDNVARFIVAVALAFALWAWVEATNDPETQRTISNIPVIPANLPPSLVVTSELPTVTVRIQGAQSRVQALESGAIQATVDLGDVTEPGMYTRRVQVELPARLRLREVIPPEVTLQIDRLAERTDVPVEVTIANELPPNLELVSTQADPQTATIRGPEQRVNQVARVTAPIQITGQTEIVRESVALVPVDENGITVPGITVEPSTANVTVQLRIRGQVRRVIPSIVGADRLAPGYELAGPPTVFPTDEVVVRAEESRTLQGIPVTPMNVRPGTTAELSPATVDLELSGPSDLLDRLDPAEILVFVDVENADAGVYQLPVRVTLPPGVRFERVTPAVVQVTVRTPTTPGPAPSP